MEYNTKIIRNDNFNNFYGKNNTNKNQGYRIKIEKKDQPIKTRKFLNPTEEYISKNLIYQIENKASEYLSSELYRYLYKTSKEYKSDISGIGRHASINFLTTQDLDNYHWLDNYSSANFAVQLNVGLKSGYFLTNE